jgi:phage gpG-like protein
MITAFLVGDTELIARLNAMPARVHGGLVRAITRLGLELQRKVQDEKLSGQVLKVRSGRLRGSIKMDVSDTATSVTSTVGSYGVEYARIQEYGGTTGPHTIMPKHGRALAFEWKGQQVFFRRVEHPGSKIPERSFLRSALRDMEPMIKAEIEAAVRQEVRAA